jgi:hypothetical protein
MTADELAQANIKEIRQANRSAPGELISEPQILVFDMSDERTAELATICFRGERPKDKVAIWAKPADLTRNWLIRNFPGDDGERLAGLVAAPKDGGQIKALVFNADGCTLLDLC